MFLTWVDNCYAMVTNFEGNGVNVFLEGFGSNEHYFNLTVIEAHGIICHHAHFHFLNAGFDFTCCHSNVICITSEIYLCVVHIEMETQVVFPEYVTKRQCVNGEENGHEYRALGHPKQ